ncbi:MAG: hypothetical protein U9Q83_07615, partial [Bacteroidota bacterium]|nr:hypothetical protein [Bacteroidota bacterium]
MRKILIAIVFIISAIITDAQEFIFRADLIQVDSSGYYHIFLNPQITSKLNDKFSDIRIYDKRLNEVPYIRLSEEDEMFKTASSKKLRIIENFHKRQKRESHIILNNSDKLDITNFVIIVNNPNKTEVWVDIAGSNDRKIWNVLKDHSRYMPEYSDSNTTEIRINNLPETSYQFYRIVLYDIDKVVFKVRYVLNYDIIEKDVEYVKVMKPIFFQDDTSEVNKTILNISFKEPQYIDKIKFYISKPSYYLRKAEVTKKDSTTGKKIRLLLFDPNQKDFFLCSDSSNILLLSRYYTKELFLVVNNNDDQPLVFDNLFVYQKKEYIVAYLEKSKKYHISFGNKNVPLPIYDLKFFKNKIPVNCPIVLTKNFENNFLNKKENKNIVISPLFLWIIFSFVVIILIL